MENIQQDMPQSPMMGQNIQPSPMAPMEQQAPKQTNNGLKLIAVFASIIAICGIGFGTYGLVDGAQKSERISNLEAQIKAPSNNTETPSGNNTDETTPSTDSGFKNSVITSDPTEEEYFLRISPSILSNGKNIEARIRVKNGAMLDCTLYNMTYSDTGGTTGKKINDCSVTGLTGEIYKIVEFGEGQDATGSNIGFIMTDGTMKYIPLVDALENNNFSIRGNVDAGGYIVDSIPINVMDVATKFGSTSTIFVLSDGSDVKFDNSMLK